MRERDTRLNSTQFGQSAAMICGMEPREIHPVSLDKFKGTGNVRNMGPQYVREDPEAVAIAEAKPGDASIPPEPEPEPAPEPEPEPFRAEETPTPSVGKP